MDVLVLKVQVERLLRWFWRTEGGEGTRSVREMWGEVAPNH